MSIGIAILTAIAAGAVAAAIVYVVYFTIKKLRQLIRERLERKKKSEVAFGETRKIIDEYGKDILKNAPTMTMEDLEKICDETPYFIVDYDRNTDDISDYTTIKTDGVDEKINDLMFDNDGIIVFS